MLEIVKGTSPRKYVHMKILIGVLPLWVLVSVWVQWVANGASAIFEQQPSLVVGAAFFFLLDFWTAVIFRIWIRGEESFSSRGLASGAKKLALWVVVGAGATIWANTFPNEFEEIRWYDPRWLGANIDLLGFLYMYAVDIISSIENVTGKHIGKTRVGRFFRAVVGNYFPKIGGTIESLQQRQNEAG